jgi:hypothetical protein
MKRNFITVVLVTLVALFSLSSKMFAADTLVVFATGHTLDNVINSDTTSTGAQKHVYKLVSVDTTYIFDAAIIAKSDLTIIGQLGTTGNNVGRPPCIQPDVLQDLTIPPTLFILVGNNTIATFKNIYFMGLSINASPTIGTKGVAISVTGDRVKLHIDNCVFEEWRAYAIGYSGQWDDFFIYNSKFRNTVDPTQQYEGEVIRNTSGSVYTDSIVMKYNTIFCVNCYSAAPVTKFYEKYFEFSHNSVVYSFKNPFFIFNVTDAKINNNIFYNAWIGGISRTEYPWWDQLWSPEVGSLIDMDSLSVATDSVFDPTSYGNANARALAEAKRNVEVKNNVYFWPSSVTTFWHNWNDTATVDSIYTPTWMNTRTTNMFTNHTGFPGFVQSGNQNVDPGYGTSIVNILTASSGPNNVSFEDYFRTMRANVPSTTIWGYFDQTINTTGVWKPNWPLPEAADMNYSNTALKTGGTDGLPVGDPYWFNGITGIQQSKGQVPNQFALFNNYPNPFNPSTTIKFNIAQAGNVSLKIYNVMGQLVRTVIDNSFKASGAFEYSVKMDNLTSGIYFYTLTQGNQSLTKKMVLLK